ncbi:hypothetical protein LMG27198_00010 [Methylocystis echinoides]|uniref:Uncharacterized protein n=1 Tax=Methylocystis echinoides TaxID=29468 RepID=A0A9W6GQ78_9HYPH|nr:hypothetical protein LMG27198_00010 [Methylocystis echinoides]
MNSFYYTPTPNVKPFFEFFGEAVTAPASLELGTVTLLSSRPAPYGSRSFRGFGLFGLRRFEGRRALLALFRGA